MFIDANRIIELIEIAKECDEKLPEDQKRIHVLDIAATLQNLIDEEAARLEVMAAEFEEQEKPDDGLFELVEIANKRMAELGAVDFDWPYGV